MFIELSLLVKMSSRAVQRSCYRVSGLDAASLCIKKILTTQLMCTNTAGAKP